MKKQAVLSFSQLDSKTHSGLLVGFRQRVLKIVFWEAILADLAEHSASSAILGGVHWFDSLYHLLNEKDKSSRNADHKGTLRLLCVQGVMTAAGLHQAGYSEESLSLCLHEHGIEHRIWDCDAVKPFILKYDLSEDMSQVKQENLHLALWHSVLTQDPTIAYTSLTTDYFMFYVLGSLGGWHLRFLGVWGWVFWYVHSLECFDRKL